MAVINQEITDRYAIYNGDCVEVMQNMPDNCIDMSIYSPPFGGLYSYSSSERDLSNCTSYEDFFNHYDFVVQELHRITKPGRMSAVHCMPVPKTGANAGRVLIDFPGDIIRQHNRLGWDWVAEYYVWKEPLAVRRRTMAKGLAHRQLCEDSARCDNALADILLLFRKRGENAVPIEHPTGLDRYVGEREMPAELTPFRNYPGKQTENRFSHWIWRRYADAFWDDVRVNRVLPYREAKDPDDEKHVHPLQLDVIERACVLWSNPGEVVLTPFMGVGSEVYGAVINGRKGVGIELKTTYFKQAQRNMLAAVSGGHGEEMNLDMEETAAVEVGLMDEI
jgi:DNA modification methylase